MAKWQDMPQRRHFPSCSSVGFQELRASSVMGASIVLRLRQAMAAGRPRRVPPIPDRLGLGRIACFDLRRIDLAG
jgi:hypothetical protein